MQYFDLYREVEIQSKLMEIIYPMYEQAKLEEARETPTVLVLDHAVPPEKKARPLRALIVISSFVLGLTLCVLLMLFVDAGLRDQANAGELRRKYRDLSTSLAHKLGPRQ